MQPVQKEGMDTIMNNKAKTPDGKYAWTAKIGEKGQIVIPKEARELFNMQPGNTVMLLADEKRGVAIINTESYMPLFDHIFGGNKGGGTDE